MRTPKRLPGWLSLFVACCLVLLALIPAAFADGQRAAGAAPSSPSSHLAACPAAAGDCAGAASHIVAIAARAMRKGDLNAVILSVWSKHQIASTAMGYSLPGQRATTDMHFRIGAVAIPYLATVLLGYFDSLAARELLRPGADPLAAAQILGAIFRDHDSLRVAYGPVRARALGERIVRTFVEGITPAPAAGDGRSAGARRRPGRPGSGGRGRGDAM